MHANLLKNNQYKAKKSIVCKSYLNKLEIFKTSIWLYNLCGRLQTEDLLFEKCLSSKTSKYYDSICRTSNEQKLMSEKTKYLTQVMFVCQVSRFNIQKTVTRYSLEYASTILRDIDWFFDRTSYNEYNQIIFETLILVLPCPRYNNRKNHQNCGCNNNWRAE